MSRTDLSLDEKDYDVDLVFDFSAVLSYLTSTYLASILTTATLKSNYLPAHAGGLASWRGAGLPGDPTHAGRHAECRMHALESSSRWGPMGWGAL